MDKIGIGIITCNRPKYLKELLDSLLPCKSDISELVVINDGDRANESKPDWGNFIQNQTRLGVGKSKNKALSFLLEKKCKYVFLIEDDVLIKQHSVFKKYIEASQATGIKHFNYGPGTPFNRKQTIESFDIHNRHELSPDTKPNPKLIVEYKNGIKIALYEHVAGMFSFFDSDVLKKVGLFDERFYNAWEHVDHTYRIIKAGFHPPFWWFADIDDSDQYIGEQQDAIANSSIAKDSPEWLENVRVGALLYKQIHGHLPNQPQVKTKNDVLQTLKQIKHG